MRDFKGSPPGASLKARHARSPGQCSRWRRLAAGFAAGLVVAACADTPPLGAGLGQGRPIDALGLVAVTDGRAAFAARDILALGGSAADAAVAAALVLAVVDPAAASLGGGGACLVRDSIADETLVLDFLPGTPMAATTGLAAAIPGSIRGLVALSRRHGRLEWWQLIETAGRLARFGTLVDSGLAADLAAAARLRDDRSARHIFFADGEPLATGDELTQLALAAMLGRLARNGAGDFYVGGVAQAISRGAEAAGMGLARSDLDAYLAKWRTPSQERHDGLAVDTAGAGTGPAPAATVGLAVVDADGLWVACTLTMGTPFGSARMAESTGILLADAGVARWLGGAAPLAIRDGDGIVGIAAGLGESLADVLAAVRDGGVPGVPGVAILCPSGVISSQACTVASAAP